MGKYFYGNDNGNGRLVEHLDKLGRIPKVQLLCLADLITYLLYRESRKDKPTMTSVAVKMNKLYGNDCFLKVIKLARMHGIVVVTDDFTVMLRPKDDWFQPVDSANGPSKDIKDSKDLKDSGDGVSLDEEYYRNVVVGTSSVPLRIVKDGTDD